MRLLRAFLLGCLIVGAWATSVAANGLPTPIPGVTSGPDGPTLQKLAEGHGLTCQSFGGGIAPETSCTRSTPDGSLGMSVVFYTNPALVMVASASGQGPLPAEIDTFLRDLSRPFCAPDSIEAFFDTVLAQGTPQAGTDFAVPGRCRLRAVTFDANGRIFRTVDAFAGSVAGAPTLVPVLPSGPPATAGTLPSAGPQATAAPVPGPLVRPTPGTFAGSIAKPSAVPLDAAALVQSLAIALLALLLVPFPAQLFNSTLEEHHDEVRGWFRWFRLPRAFRGGADLWRSPLGVALFILIGAVLYALLDPGLGLDLGSAAEVLGFAIGIVVTTLVFSLPPVLAHRRLGDAWSVRVLPLSLVVGAGCVLVSRLASFEPGYLYGVLLGLTFGRDLGATGEARSISVASVTMVVVALFAWFLLGVVGTTGDVLGIALRTALASTMVAGLEGAALGLLPLRFQPGERVWAWNRIVWATLFAAAMFLFVLILVNPASGYLADSSRTPLITIVALLVAFGGTSIAFWAYFRFRPAGRDGDSARTA